MEPTNRACRWVGRRLPLLVGAELTGADRRRVERHLIVCGRCRERRDAAAQSLAVLRLARGPHPSAGPAEGGPALWPALARQIRESRRLARTPAGGSNPLAAGRVRLALAAGVVAVGGAVGLGLGWARTHRPVEVAREVDGRVPLPRSAPAAPGLIPAPATGAHVENIDPFLFGLGALELGVQSSPPRPPAPAAASEPRELAVAGPVSDPFRSPTTLRLDFDLDQGTVAPPAGRDTQRAY